MKYWNVLVWDRGDIRWFSGGPFAEHAEADRVFKDWDRVTGPDNHRCYALGVGECKLGEKAPPPEFARVMLEAAFEQQEGQRRSGGSVDVRTLLRQVRSSVLIKVVATSGNVPLESDDALFVFEAGEIDATDVRGQRYPYIVKEGVARPFDPPLRTVHVSSSTAHFAILRHSS